MKYAIWSLLLLVSAASAADAQYYRPYRYGRGGGGYGYATTPMQGMAYGAAAMTAAQGQANLSNAKAAQAYQQAYSQQLDNKLKATETYFEMRRVNREAQQAERDARNPKGYGSPTLSAPKPTLSPTQLDPVTGTVSWTPALMSPEYAGYREQIESYFKNRAQHLGTGGAVAVADLRKTSSALMDELNKHINDMPSQDWVDAKRLIDGLLYTATQPLT